MAEEAKQSWFQRNKRYALLGIAGVILIPIFSFQAMKERKAKEAEEGMATFEVDEKTPGVSLVFTRDEPSGLVQYQDGTRIPLDGHGVAAMLWEDFQNQPERFGDAGKALRQSDFPVVVFFNSSAFDATGDPMILRRAKDGSPVFELADRPQMIKAMTPLRDGTFRVITRSGEPKVVSEADWYKTYVGVAPPKKLPSLEEMRKMTPEALLDVYGVVLPPDDNRPAESTAKAGVKGRVIRVGGNPAVTGVECVLKIYKGKVDPKSPPAVAVEAKTDKDGSYSVALAPGEYTMTVEVGGKTYGNARNADKWPSLTVTADEWLEYEFRVSG